MELLLTNLLTRPV